jgi:hypothetical protein
MLSREKACILKEYTMKNQYPIEHNTIFYSR